VIVYVPIGVDGDVEMVIVLLAEGELGLIVTEPGLNETDAPEGRPEAEKLMALEFTPL